MILRTFKMSILCYLVHDEKEKNSGSAFTLVSLFSSIKFTSFQKTAILLPRNINNLKPGQNSDWKQYLDCFY